MYKEILLLISGIAGLWLSSSIMVSVIENVSYKHRWSMMGLASIVLASLTSLPELMVSVVSVINHESELALGNLFGSYAANICLVIGCCALIAPINIQAITFKFKIPMLYLLLLATVMIQFIDYVWVSILMFMGYFVYMKFTLDLGEPQDELESDFPFVSSLPTVPLLLVAALVLFVSTEAVIDSSVSLAKMFGVSEYWIGMTVVAIGTSLPELVTSVLAHKKGLENVVIAQVVGSNVFMFFLVLPVILLMGAKFQSISLIMESIYLIIITTILLIFSRFFDKTWAINRLEGVIMVAVYFIYVAFH